FHTAARRLSFTKAAQELLISQPAVTKHIKEIEQYFKVALFERNGSKLKLTAAGRLLLQHTETLFALYRTIDFDMHALGQQQSGSLRIGASTTVSNYILPQAIAAFRRKFSGIQLSVTTANTEQTEDAVLDNEVDLGIIEGKSRKAGLQYTDFLKDELVLVTGAQSRFATKKSVTVEELRKMPVVLREAGSGTLDVIAHALKPLGLTPGDLTIDVKLDSSESIKGYLQHSNSVAFLSVHAVGSQALNKDFCSIEIKGFRMQRLFYFIRRQGEAAALPALFMRFAKHYNFKL
ncbi:MAG TPA: LysR family transcriptional regulator, partial [Chitinophagaceae bacterium]|nr:LysR family transcriptional regulator [Chitinophagaceae bacterium]